jgi:hypothetical protein
LPRRRSAMTDAMLSNMFFIERGEGSRPREKSHPFPRQHLFPGVAQTSQSAVSRVSQPADASPTGRARLLNGLLIGKSAIQQVGKPAVRIRHRRSGPSARAGRSAAANAPERRCVVGFGRTAARDERVGPGLQPRLSTARNKPVTDRNSTQVLTPARS